jgi:trk system potassium uptake protein TrkA
LNILILGAGQVGSELSEILAEGHDVTLIDTDQEKLRKISDHHDLRTICGNGCFPKTLEQAEIETVDLAVAMTQWDEVNMVACQMIKHMNKKTKTMARIRATQYLGGRGSEIFEAGEYSIDVVISPENLITNYITKLIKLPGAMQVLDFGNGLASMVQVKATLGAPITGHKISELKDHIPNADTRVAAIYRDNSLIIPTGEDYINHQDEVFFITAKSNLKKVMLEIREVDSKYKHIMIAGGGRIGRRIANALEEKFRVKIIERNKERCIYLSEKLSNSLVLNGDTSDAELLEEENIDQVDMFCAVTDNDEANVMSSLLAKKLGAKNVLTLVNKKKYIELIKSEDVEISIAPTQITIGDVLKNVNGSNLANAYSFKGGKAEALEIIVDKEKNNGIINKTIEEIKMPEGCTLGAVLTGNKVKIAHHDVKIQENDHLIIFLSDKNNFEKLEKLIR